MAMSYNILKTLTIDGTTMGVDTEIGTSTQGYKTGVSIAAGTWNKSAQLTIPETGLYAILCFTDFSAASTTGATLHQVGWGNAANTAPNHRLAVWDAVNNGKLQSFAWIEPLNKGVTVANFTSCNKACTNCTILIRAIRLLSYPGGA